MYHMLRAARAHGIRRIVHTGPFLVDGPGAPGAAYIEDYDLTEAAPPRTYDYLYHHTKYLSLELARVFAEQAGLEIPVLLFAGLTDPTMPGGPGGTFTISWADAARAVRRALEIPRLPNPLEVFHVAVERPQRKFDVSKLRTVLGWQPLDRLDHHWRR
jgi:nucleoside-diphosphate-sugar epimerase